jgi:hypothetical protein
MNEDSGEKIRKSEKEEKMEEKARCESVAILEGDGNDREGEGVTAPSCYQSN